jgi:hypothetical protein
MRVSGSEMASAEAASLPHCRHEPIKLPGQFFAHVDEAAVGAIGTEERQSDTGLRAVRNFHRCSVSAHFRFHPAGVGRVDLDLGVLQFRGEMDRKSIQRGLRRIVGQRLDRSNGAVRVGVQS